MLNATEQQLRTQSNASAKVSIGGKKPSNVIRVLGRE
jgi:hypothetical protein